MVDKQEENQVQTAIRLPESWLERIDKLADGMSQPGRPATRAGAPTHCEHNVALTDEWAKRFIREVGEKNQ